MGDVFDRFGVGVGVVEVSNWIMDSIMKEMTNQGQIKAWNSWKLSQFKKNNKKCIKLRIFTKKNFELDFKKL